MELSLEQIGSEAEKAVSTATSLEELEKTRVHYLGKSGVITSKMKTLGSLPVEERKTFGAEINKLKDNVSGLIERAKGELEENAVTTRLQRENLDITLPVRPRSEGRVHPVTRTIHEVIEILGDMGFLLAEGPDIEDDFHNFTALNIPEEHPARQMHDTFYFPPDETGKRTLLRTHTSPVQIRAMKAGKPPFRIIAAGRTYRCDSDTTHSPMFHQIEGLYVDKNVNMGHLKGCLIEFVRKFFEIDNVPVRFRPSFFPFTEPSAEMDIGCSRDGGELKIGVGDKWLEILGCGMVHHNVLKNVGIDPEQYQGFAFGMGVERIAMLKYGIPDLRTFFESDIRWLEYYGFSPLSTI